MSTASDLLAKYLEAEEAILSGQSYTIGDRVVTRADLEKVKTEREKLERRVASEDRVSSGLYGPRHQLGDFS